MDHPRTPDEQAERARAGLCADCEHASRVRSDKGTLFYLCRLSATDPGFAKYPRLPVRQCAGYRPMAGE